MRYAPCRNSDLPVIVLGRWQPIEGVLREFRNRVERSGILFELAKRESFTPRPEARRRKRARAQNRRAA